MNMKANSFAFAGFFIGLLLLLALTTTPVQAIELRQGVDADAYIHGASSTYELTVPSAEVDNYSDMFDFQKGAHYTMLKTEGSAVHLSVLVSNNLAQQITVEGKAFIRIKPTPEDSWSTLWSDNAKDTVNAGHSQSSASEDIDFTVYGWWDDGAQLHFCLGLKVYPSADSSDWTYSAFSIWFTIGETSTSTPPSNGDSGDSGDGDTEEDTGNGDETDDSTTTAPETPEQDRGTPDEYGYWNSLSFLDPFANSLGTSRQGAVVIISVIGLFAFALIVAKLTKEPEG
jgi:hypothetical protein